MKARVIEDYNKLLKRAARGYRDDYEPILEKISFIEIGGKLDNATKVYQLLMLN